MSTNHSELAYQLERIASRERALHKLMALPPSDCEYLERAAIALRAIAMAPKAETEGLRGLSPAKRGAKQSPKVSQ